MILAMQNTTFCVILLSFCFFISQVQSENDYDYEGSVPKNCPTSEDIAGGRVEYSNNGVEGSLVIFHCSKGFEPYPVGQKICNSDGEWAPKISRIKCEEINDYGDYEETQRNCSLEESLKGGNVSYSNEGLEGSVLTYHCKAREYPFPTAQRVCDRDGQWSAMRLPNGKRVFNAICKEILCPAHLQLDNGQIWPRKQWFKVGELQTFACDNGFALLGSSQRNCTRWGMWTGTTPVCDDHSNDCKNPGSPPGSLRSGERFRIGDGVRYQCQLGLDMLGSSERKCLDSREWSGVEPRCYAQYSFDPPAFVAQALEGSMSAFMDVSLPEFKKKGPSFGRSLRVADASQNIFILLDTSGSISQEGFEKVKKATIKLVEKLDSYEVNMKFDIISYASEPKNIVSITDINSGNLDYIMKKLHEFSYQSHGTKKGTNLSKALNGVYTHLVFFRETSKSHFNQTQNIIIIATDGHSNMGPKPKITLDKIRSLFGYRYNQDHTDEKLLDVYVFAVGQNVNKNELKTIASFKKDEQHIFVLENYDQLGFVFNQMINDSAVTTCGMAQEEQTDSSEKIYTRPWHVNIDWNLNKNKCRGSLLTKSWVLTAAHCFVSVKHGSLSIANASEVKVEYENVNRWTSVKTKVLVAAKKLILHRKFDLKGLKGKNVKEFYDYDIALVKLSENITISLGARPVCLPCTNSSNLALKMGPDTTCDQHKRLLLDLNETLAYFIRQGTHRSNTLIHSGAKRGECIQPARSIFANTSASLREVITDRFICTGGSETHRHEITCKGDSGGALLLRKRMRYFQVGVISWGTTEICGAKTVVKDADWPSDARDFHISVFSLMPWLRQHLHKDLEFLKDT
ncbi:complement C2 [Triplophysa dalaica]|uniref:complement C2 n=1 Tax=Triplophysa dalaica TaxID=1582913 RepID=UPI0024E02862|nr:complement C2 [Triplophysa dalaica]